MFRAAVCRSSESCGERATTSRNRSRALRSRASSSLSSATDDIFLRRDARPQKRPEAHDFDDPDSVESLEEYNGIAVRHAHELVDFGSGADGVQVGRSGFFDARIMLRDDAQRFLVALQRVQEGQRTVSAHGDGLDAARKENNLPDGQNGKLFGSAFIDRGHVTPMGSALAFK